MILLCNLVKACSKFFNMRGYTDLMKFIVWARTMLFCEAITRPASRLLWNTAASRFLTSPDSASGHLKAQRQILNHNLQVTVLRRSFSKLQVYCMNSPRATLTHYSFTCKGKRKIFDQWDSHRSFLHCLWPTCELQLSSCSSSTPENR